MYSARAAQVSDRIVMEIKKMVLEADQHKRRCLNWKEKSPKLSLKTTKL